MKPLAGWLRGMVLVLGLFGLCLFAAAPAGAQSVAELEKKTSEWPMYHHDLAGTRFSPLDQITTRNMKSLALKWIFQTGNVDEGLNVTPIVVDGVMYVTTGGFKTDIFALDAKTGRMKWRTTYENAANVPLCCGTLNRGVAVGHGKVYYLSLDAHLVAFDAKTGQQLWKTQIVDFADGFSNTSPPILVKNLVIAGIAGAEFPVRCFLDAYDAETGKRVWRFYTIPGPGEPGNETWGGDSWQYGGGSTWLPGTYDPETNLIYWGIGNPAPFFYGDVRPGDNLYTTSLVALDADTGKLKWYFQHIPHDVWDFDSMNEPILVNTTIGGKAVKAVVQVHKNGYVYALDRVTGKPLYATQYVKKINWTKGLTTDFKPIPDVVPTPEGATIWPSLVGGKNWNHAAYNPKLGLIFIPGMDAPMIAISQKQEPKKGLFYLGGEYKMLPGDGPAGFVSAIDAKTGKTVWRNDTKYPQMSSVLATAGDLVFYGDPDGTFVALDARTGKELWSINTGAGHRASPISYLVDGKQYIAVPSGWGGGTAMADLPSAWPEMKNFTKGDAIVVFGLPD